MRHCAIVTLQAKEIEVEHLQQRLAEKDGHIADARTSEEEAKVSLSLVNCAPYAKGGDH